MRLTFIFVVVVVAILHTTGASLPLTKDSKAGIQKDEYDIDDFDDFIGDAVKKLKSAAMRASTKAGIRSVVSAKGLYKIYSPVSKARAIPTCQC
ncbi:hypothetical protein PF005_g15661 [Phytophthora fragariae]|uniref:RxLR effector protein n=1 Tax=Phytophthora fragariae TaxID=53985 RepID=A0A6A4D9C3_9STRA|nr:hypothetical protein PF003_g27806 [Phytophthora fragariae]KAE8936172.1 hypothetical protein PF009_g13894 [Phytophthora fragariae]KAE8998802.1 hypothetical protein PF011_g14895 [Phytophthora fragariae]KAE9098982.1 hypothetical protein PF010_g15355 [Phytophthora fragariae]KAE9099228.1 hypothetical protein PF007_g15949 [Phytophthora fragariae]